MAFRRRASVGAVCVAIALIALMPATAAAAEQIVCGKILGSIGPQANAAGSFVIPQPGDAAPAGTYIVIPAGTQFSYAQPPVWVCVRTIDSPPTPVMGTQISSLTFLNFVQAGSPGYRAEPIPVGGLPNTSTAPAGTLLPPVTLFASVLLALGGAYVRRRAEAERRRRASSTLAEKSIREVVSLPLPAEQNGLLTLRDNNAMGGSR